ncbi:hypothetical protein M407DRAFT_245832 [Tulasnella calospora MUT 4182]|uniref:MPN domain-containing protein n=1 Tax=Tulasnella calospora MUT 4182 TaxID=1051891 RepID=A0A0C3LFZ1_9AGAM|nr:hypothetical protein M407DRAFT_245832 [Tulasnella calospora MUT 4182]
MSSQAPAASSAPSFTLQEKAYLKFFLHAAKHPHASVTGVFLGRRRVTEGQEEIWDVVDAVPLCHHWTSLSPMGEVGLELASIHAKETESRIVGYYHASSWAQDVALPAHGHHVLQSLTREFPLAFALVFNASKLSTDSAAIDVVMIEPSKQNSRNTPRPEKFDLEDPETPARVRSMVRRKKLERLIVDFDDYLEDPSKDWLKNVAVLPLSVT